MKHILTLILLILLLTPTSFSQPTMDGLMADSAKLYVEYADYRGYTNDSIFISLSKTSLFLGKKAAVFYYQRRSPEEMRKEVKENMVITSGNLGREETLKSLEDEGMDFEKQGTVMYIKPYSTPEYLRFQPSINGDLWISDTQALKWKPENEFKTIAGYKCQKAIHRSTDGAETIAWFTEDIPFSVGPFYFSGLPGLILEFYDLKNKRLITATTISSTEIPEQRFRKWLTGHVVTKAKYNNLRSEDLKKAEQFKKMLESNQKNPVQ